MYIYLLRHGETNWNLEGRLQGQRDVMMNERGISQIQKAGEILAGLNVNIEVILASPLMRALKSAEIVADRLGYAAENIVTEPLFMERSFGGAEGLIYKEIEKDFLKNKFQKVETVDALCERAGKAFQKTVESHEGKNILIAAHGAVLKALIQWITNGNIKYESPQVKFFSGSIYLLEYDNGIVEIFYYNMEKEEFDKVEY